MNTELKNGKYIYPNRIEFYLNGEKHRECAPAIEWESGGVEWWFKGKLHRENGPAITLSNGNQYWYLFGNQYTEEEFNQWKIKKELNEKLNSTLTPKSIIEKRKI